MKRRRWRSLWPGVVVLMLAALWPGPLAPDGQAATGPLVVRQAPTIEIAVSGDVIVGRPAELTFRAANPAGDANQGSITVSLPGNPNIEIVGASAPGAKLFQPGEQMFNFAAGRNATIQVPAVELFVSAWPPGVRHEVKLRVTATTPYTVQARASFRRAGGDFAHLPANGPADQQGAPTRLVDVTPRQANPPTPTRAPAPPTATVPPPPPTQTPPPTDTPLPPATATSAPEKPAGNDTPIAAAPAPPPAPTATMQAAVPPAAPPARPPAAPPAATQPPTPTAGGGPSGDGPSMPLLLAGLGIMGVGVAIGLVAVLLVLRRTSGSTRTTEMPPPVPPQPYDQGGSGGSPGAGPQYESGPLPYGPSGQHQRTAPWSTPAPSEQPRPPRRRGEGPVPPWGPPPTAPLPWERQQDFGPVNGPPGFGPVNVPPMGGPTRPATPARSGPDDRRRDQGATPRPPSPPADADHATGGHMARPSSTRYVDRVLKGRGGMGSVYKAYDARLQRPVALKIMHADLGMQPGFIQRFIREAQVAALLEHPNIVTVYDIEQVGDSIQMVMSWIDGEDLQQLLEREGSLPPERAARLLVQMAAALDHAHLRERPVLHRDIKPSNIMIGPHERVVLTDFGIARILGDVALTQVGQMVGTPAFMAPEVVQGREADHRADVYALGVVLYQMLTGRAPFRAETPLALLHAQVHTPPPPPRSFVPLLSTHVDAVLMQALAKNPDARFQTAGDLARAFARAVGRG